MSFNKDHFNNPNIWNYSDFQLSVNREKYDFIKNAIDLKSESMLDVGCGNGDMLRQFSKDIPKLYGADFSEAGLKNLNEFATPVILDLESDNQEPLGEFDVVSTFDVLEHLRPKALDNAIKLIKGSAKKLIIVNVPNNENLELRRSNCKFCKTIYHPYGHINSFSESDIIKLFCQHNIRHVTTGKVGPEKPYCNFYLSALSKHVFGDYMVIETATCPACSRKAPRAFKRMPAKLFNFINRLIGRFATKEREELILIFAVDQNI